MYRISRLTPALTLIFLLWGSTAGSIAAQQVADPPSPEKDPAVQTQQTPDDQSTPAAGMETDATEVESSPGEEDINSSPFDYKPSEKISEDLSVSFPVDI
jgi:hypothetical protein